MTCKRTTLWATALVLALGWAFVPRATAEEARVELPLTLWESIQARIAAIEQEPSPPAQYCPIIREVDGRFHKGLFQGHLKARFQVLDDQGHVRVPVLDSNASLGKVELNGNRTSLLREGSLYSVGVDKPGTYQLEADFYVGKEQDRYDRRLRFLLPESGITGLTILVPEKNIQAALSKGALRQEDAGQQGTRLIGHLDASGRVELTWTRRLTHAEGKTARLRARQDTLFSIGEALISGVAVFDFDVLQGETDRIDLRLPKGVEIIRVEGDAVLQWQTSGSDALKVLMRYLVADAVRVSVHFQYPLEPGEAFGLFMPLPLEGVVIAGHIGVQAPAGLNVTIASEKDATQLLPRDLPENLVALSPTPLVFGFRYEQPPEIRLKVTRHAQVELTSTLVDELQASTVIIEDGMEITKLKLRIRNNTRQYLHLNLPDGSELTHCLIDGQAVRPALADGKQKTRLLLPLRQSERILASGERIHVVRTGETLSDLANFYFSDPGQWDRILDFNRAQLGNAQEVVPGQHLRIPLAAGVSVEESSFVIELAYKRKAVDKLGILGSLAVALPVLDVDVVKTVWHLYFPQSHEPLSFDANLTQFSAIRYDPFSRLKSFLSRVFWERNAWAGDKYRSILKQRKEIYHADASRRSASESVLTTFPLVGQRFRFKRALLGREVPRIELTYVNSSLAGLVRWLGFLAAFALTLVTLRKSIGPAHWAIVAVGLVLLLILAHYFLGLHRRLVWGVDAALLVALLKLRYRAWLGQIAEFWKSPWSLVELLTFQSVFFLIGLISLVWLVLEFPLLLSTLLMAAGLFWWRRKARKAVMEVGHV